MNASIRNGSRLAWAALRALLVLTLLTGVLYPLVVTGIAQAAFPGQADGSLVRSGGKDVGSSLIGQTWNGKDGKPAPQWFQPRPSAGDYDPLASGASNLAATSPELRKDIEARKTRIADFNGVPLSAVPADAVTASGSGLDPDISPAYARIQTGRVAEARHLDPSEVRGLVDRHTQGRVAGFLGEPRVDVLELNLALRDLPG